MVLGVVSANVSIANAATKTITCYKGTAVKKVKAVSPKCPKGWTTKKPAVKVTPKPAVTKPVVTPTKPAATASTKPEAGAVAFNATYKGQIKLVWSDSDVRATSVTADGTGTTAGLGDLSGSGSSAPQAECAEFDGVGTLSGGGNTLKVKFDSNAKACAADGAAPTAIAITGTASITGGTGKFAGATGTLKVTGSFAIKSKDAGFSESSAFTITLSGSIDTK